ncbi:cbb3-type cytochrome oxidase assembly protein CcoS [bacterium]|nr:cbb3-type cytochrome oxidase assembly protein CcoS [bacterium]
MNILYFLVPLALLLAGVGVWAFIWSVKNGQFEDVETPGIRMLFDDEDEEQSTSGRNAP